MNRLIFMLALLASSASVVQGATKHDEHAPINHCYHWLDEGANKYLTYKYSWANNNDNELTFYTTPGTSNGSVAGPGLYCAKAPSGSYNYGNRLIRIDFVEDVVLYDDKSNIQYCGLAGETSRTSQECAEKNWDVKFFNGGGRGNAAWYVIQNPMAILSWSANSDALIADLNENIAVNDVEFKNHANATINAMKAERASMGEQIFYNANARISVVDLILNDPEKLNGIPPLNIVSRLIVSKDDRITTAEKEDTYKKYIFAALKSDELYYKDYKKLIDRHEIIAQAFQEAVLVNLHSLDKHNGMAMLEGIMARPQAYSNITDENFEALVADIFSNPYHMEELGSKTFQTDPRLAKHVGARLEGLKASPDRPAKIGALKNFINNYYSESEREAEKAFWIDRLYSIPSKLAIVLGADSYALDEEASLLDQCQGLLELTGLKDVNAELAFYKTKLPLGPTDEGVCQRAESVFNAIKDLPKDQEISFVLNGRVENTYFLFAGNYLEDFREQCQDFYATVPNKSRVDEVYWSLNGSAQTRAYKSKGYWTTGEEVCAQAIYPSLSTLPVKLTAKWKKEASQSSPTYIASGRIEKLPFYFYGENLDEVIDKCDQFYSNIPNKSYVDEIYWSVNGSDEERSYKSQGYWNSKDAVCDQISSLFGNTIPSKALLLSRARVAELKEEARQKKPDYIVSGRFEKQEYIFFGDNQDEVMAMCEEFYPYVINKTHVDEIFWSVNGQDETREYNERSYWKTKQAVCSTLQSKIQGQVPTLALLQERARKARLLKEYKVFLAKQKQSADETNPDFVISGKFETQEYIFFGDNQEAVIAMCEEFYPYVVNKSHVDEIFWSVNGQDEIREYNERSYWRTKDELCSALKSVIDTHVPTIAVIAERERKARLLAKATAFLQEQEQRVEEATPDYVVSGNFNGQDYLLYGNNLEEAREMCSAFYPYLLNTRIDRIHWSVNGSGLRESYNKPAYWETEDALCQQLTSAISHMVPTAKVVEGENLLASWRDQAQTTTPEIAFTARIAGQEFELYGQSLEEIDSKCAQYYPYIRSVNSLENIQILLEGDYEVNADPFSWANQEVLCKTVAAIVEREIAKRDDMKRMAASKELFHELHPALSDDDEEAGKQKEVMVKTVEANLYLKAKNSAELTERCLEIVPYLNEDILSASSVQILSESESHEARLHDFEPTAGGLCAELGKALFLHLPTQELLEHNNEFELADTKYKIEGRLNKAPVYFYGRDAYEIEDQCHRVYAESFSEDRLYSELALEWTVNGDEKLKKLRLERTTLTDFCSEFSKEALKGGLSRFFRRIF